MADMKQIHNFAVKWCGKFRGKNIHYIELVDHWMVDDCVALGFEMDCGHTFSEKYGQAANNHEALDRIIDNVTDVPLLGSAIYSRWRSSFIIGYIRVLKFWNHRIVGGLFWHLTDWLCFQERVRIYSKGH